MSVLKGDFIGFTFDGIHSSDLGVLRVSDGSRYTETLLPTMQDKTVVVPGADGTYYFGSQYTQRPINFPIAFDSLSEGQFQNLKAILGDKKIHTLIFDEVPYKVYRVKTTGTPNLKYVCFDAPQNELVRDDFGSSAVQDRDSLYGAAARVSNGRVYKGEGQLSFTCYTPYARSRYKFLDQYTLDTVPEWGSMDSSNAIDVYHNLYDWSEESGLISSNATKKIGEITYTVDEVQQTGVCVYNPSTIPAPFKLRLRTGAAVPTCTFVLGGSNVALSAFELRSGDSGFQINTALHLIEGIDADGAVTGTLYNQYIASGDYFDIPKTDELTYLQIYFENEPAQFEGDIIYDYLYY